MNERAVAAKTSRRISSSNSRDRHLNRCCAALGSLAVVTGGLIGIDSAGLSAQQASSNSTITVLMANPPDTLDPQATISTTSGIETDANVYLNLIEFKPQGGAAGNELIAAAAEALPSVSADGKTYTFILRKNLVYSNGTPVKASDFSYSMERALKLHWGLDSAFSGHIVGAAAYAAGKATSIAGITSDDASGTIKIELKAPYGPFEDYLALPGGASLVPSGTAMKALPQDPPVGAGPYEFASVVPNRGFTLTKNPHFAGLGIPGLPTGHIQTIQVQFVSNSSTEAEEVLQNRADSFDASDTIPATLLQQVKAQAVGRFSPEPTLSTEYFFLNNAVPPFNNLLARQAVNYAIDRGALQRLSAGFLTPSCYMLPQSLAGSVHGGCPYETPNGGPRLAQARQLVKRAKLIGAPVTVWVYPSTPVQAWSDYLASVLGSIGFKVTEKSVATSSYFSVVGNVKTHAQAGWSTFFLPPQPSIFYQSMLVSSAITSTNNNNLSMTSDPHINSTVARLSTVAASDLTRVAGQWQALERYESSKSYIIPFGEYDFVQFFSDRIDPTSAVFSPNLYNVWAAWMLK